MYKTHFFAPKLILKERVHHIHEYEFTVFLINLGTRKQDQILGCVLYTSVSYTWDGIVHLYPF